MKHGFGSPYNVSFLPLHNHILMGVLKYCELPPNACLSTKINKLTKGILPSIVRPEELDLPTCLGLHKSFEHLKPLENLTLGLQEINPGLPRVVINE